MSTSVWLDAHVAPARRWRPRTQMAAAVAVGWVPFVVLGALARLVTGRTEPLLLDVSVHVRLLVALPLFFVAELTLSHQARETLRRFGGEGFVVGDDRARLERIVQQAERLSAARASAIVLAAIAVAIGLATLAGWLSPAGVMHGIATTALTPARVWYGAVALPLSLFFFGRASWRWGVWVRTLVGLARLRLRLVPGHPDRRGGIGFVTLTSLAFACPFLLAVASVSCAHWGMELHTEGAGLAQLQGPFIALAVLGELLAFGPLFVFTPRMFLAGRRGLADYGGLTTDYVRRFDDRWLPPSRREALLGTGDIQSLNDIGGAYRESVEKMNVVPFGPRDLLVVLVVMVVPVVPLLLSTASLAAVLEKLGKLLVGAH